MNDNFCYYSEIFSTDISGERTSFRGVQNYNPFPQNKKILKLYLLTKVLLLEPTKSYAINVHDRLLSMRVY